MEDIVKIQIGKNGINEHVYREIKKHLNSKKTVKLKFLKSFLEGKDRKKVAKELGFEGKLVGNVFTIKNG